MFASVAICFVAAFACPALGELPPEQLPYFVPNFPVKSYSSAVDLAEAATMENKVQLWVDSHPEGISLAVMEENVGFTMSDNGLAYRLSTPDLSVTLMFSDPISRLDDVDSVRAKFQRIAIDKLQVPGISFPMNWNVNARTPLSSFRDGVTITSFDGEKSTIGLHVETPLLDIFGRRTDIIVPADVGLPRAAYFSVRRNEPIFLNLNLDVPIEAINF